MATKTAKPGRVDAAQVSKSSLIKEILALSPDRSPKDIAEELTSQGIPTTSNYVSTIKTNLKNQVVAPKKIKRKKAVAKAPPAAKPAVKATADAAISFDQLRMAKEMARQLGGVEQAKEVLGALIQLSE
jgi:hypothetical protein